MKILPPSAANFLIFIYIKMDFYIYSTTYKNKIFAAHGGEINNNGLYKNLQCKNFSAPAAPISIYIKIFCVVIFIYLQGI